MSRLWLSLLVVALAACRMEPGGPLTQAAANGRLPELRALLAQGADPNAVEGGGLTPLMWAARAGQIEALAVLLDAGARPDLQDGAVSGWTALQHAAHKAQNRAVEALLAHGADPNAPSRDGATALRLAAFQGNRALVETLLAGGADARAPGTLAAAAEVCLFDCNADFPSAELCGRKGAIVTAILERAPELRLGSGSDGARLRLTARLRGCADLAATIAELQVRG